MVEMINFYCPRCETDKTADLSCTDIPNTEIDTDNGTAKEIREYECKRCGCEFRCEFVYKFNIVCVGEYGIYS